MSVTLPDWPQRTIAVLATTDPSPHAIPVSAPVRAGDETVLLSLHRSRDSLARLRARPDVALLFLAEDNTAFTVRGTARVLADPLPDAPDYVAVEITATAIDDHRQAAFVVQAGVDRRWLDPVERDALGARMDTLKNLLAGALQ